MLKRQLCPLQRHRHNPKWRDIVWSDEKVLVNVTCDKVKTAPEFKASMTINRGYEEQIYTHHGYSPYWTGGA